MSGPEPTGLTDFGSYAVIFKRTLAALFGFTTALAVGNTAQSQPVAPAALEATKSGVARSTGSTEVVTGADVIDWVITLENTSSEPVGNLMFDDQLNGNQTFIADSLMIPIQFMLDTPVTNASTSLSASADELSNVDFSILEPLSLDLNTKSYTFPTGSGDGWKVVFHNETDRIFFTAHHWESMSTNCFNLEDGSACPGYPKDFWAGGMDIPTHPVNSGYEIYGNHYYFIGRPHNSYEYGVGCWNIVSEAECGWTAMGNVATAPVIDAPRPLQGFGKVSDTEWWVLDNRLAAHCFNPQTNSLCAGTSTVDFAYATAGLAPHTAYIEL